MPRLVTLLFSTVLTHALTSACSLSRSQQVSEAPTPTPPVEHTLATSLGLLAGGHQSLLPRALASLERAEKQAAEPERQMIARLKPLLARLAQDPRALSPEDYRGAAVLMEQLARRHADDFEVQMAMAAALFQLDGTMRTLTGGSEDGESPVGQDALKRAHVLASRFPNQALAQAHLGQVLTATHGDPLLAMESYALCMQLDPALVRCKAGLARTAEEYQRPRCVVIHKRKLGLHVAHAEQAPGLRGTGWRTVKLAGRTLRMETKPSLTGADVQEAQEEELAGQRTLTLWLTPKGGATFAALTARLVREQGFLVVAINGKARDASQVMSPIETGQITLRNPDVGLKKLCTLYEARTLPKNLQRHVESLRESKPQS